MRFRPAFDLAFCLPIPRRFIAERLDKVVDEPAQFKQYAPCARINRLDCQSNSAQAIEQHTSPKMPQTMRAAEE
jgi:hypothetical protein